MFSKLSSAILFAGVLLLIAGVVMMLPGSSTESQSSFGAVIFIGPFPIVFGAGPGETYLIALGIAITAIMVVISLISIWSHRYHSGGQDESE